MAFGVANVGIIANVALIFIQHFWIDTFGKLVFKSKYVAKSIWCFENDVKFDIFTATSKLCL